MKEYLTRVEVLTLNMPPEVLCQFVIIDFAMSKCRRNLPSSERVAKCVALLVSPSKIMFTKFNVESF